MARQRPYFSTGQRCTASSRLIVTEGIHDRFVEAIVERMRQAASSTMRSTADTEIGPVVDPRQLKQDSEYIAIGRGRREVADGGELLNARHRRLLPARRRYSPDASNAMRISREEIFGPVASVIRVKDYDEALSVANDTRVRLCAGIVTTSLKHATHFKRHSQSRHGDGQPADGRRRLSMCRSVAARARATARASRGAYEAEFYTTVKTAYISA